jgi:c-di-GMP-binding flagellar brake protein YcgR
MVDLPPPSPPGAPPRWTDDAATITTLLGRASEQRLVLAVAGYGNPRSSLLLGSDAVRHRVWIDLPFPAPEVSLQPDALLTLSARLDGAALDFSCRFDALESLDGQAAWRLHWPTRMRHLQRRSHFRLLVSPESGFCPALIQVPPKVAAGRLVDLSRDGAGALFPRDTSVQAGDQVRCTLRVDGLEMTAEAEVRSCVPTLNRRRVGLRFGAMARADAQRLSTIVAQCERAMLRNQLRRRERLKGVA